MHPLSPLPSPSSRRALGLAVLLWLPLAGCGDPPPGHPADAADAGDSAAPLSAEAWAEAMVAVHNRVRAETLPAPEPALAPLVWAEDLAARAQAWSEACDYRHSDVQGVGENLFATTGGVVAPEQVVDLWAWESRDYSYDTNSCAAGKECGHYTQVVWRRTARVGCGQTLCTQKSPFGQHFPTWMFVVCHYDPPGNVIGQWPY